MECLGIVVTRRNEVHLVDYTHANGNKYTVCGRCFTANDIVSFVELDGAILAACRNCHDTYDEMYLDDLNHDPRVARGGTFERRKRNYLEIQNKYLATEHKYWFLIYKDWGRLNTYRHLISRPTRVRLYGIGRKHK